MKQPPQHPVASPQTDRNPCDSPQLALGNATRLGPPAWGGIGAVSSPGTRGLQGVPRGRQWLAHSKATPRHKPTSLPTTSQRAQGTDSQAPAGPTAASPGVNPHVPGTTMPTLVWHKPRPPQPQTQHCFPQHSDSSPPRTTSLPSDQLPGHKSVAQPAFKETH